MAAKAPELIIINAQIRTLDPLQPRAEALAVDGEGRILALGDTAAIRGMANRHTRVVDAGGRLMLPGFQDTHIHLQDSGTDFSSSADLTGATTVEELQRTLADFARQRPSNAWLHGVGWNSGLFGAHNLDRSVLDAVVPDRSVFLLASDYHNAVINSHGCREIGLDAGVADPPNGQFVRDAAGELTGLMYEFATEWVRARMPKRPLEDFFEGVRFGQALCNRHGITGVLDALVRERHMVVYTRMDEAGELTVRVRATAVVSPQDSTQASLERIEALRRDYRTPLASVHSAKFFLDGVLENRTAVMLEDYSDAAGGNAALMFDRAQLAELFTAFDAARFQIHAHVIGDGATRIALDCLETARRANGAWPSLHQLAHLQMIDPADLPRFRQLGVVANIQPLWATAHPSVTEVALPMVGEERGRWMYAWRSVLQAGAPYAVSSDWGVSTLNPFPIMQVAVTRQHHREDPPFLPEERITVEDVVRGYTVNAAAAAWRSADSGSLTPGKFADLILLDRDIFAIDPYEIGGTEVDLTLLAGREVHRAAGFAG